MMASSHCHPCLGIPWRLWEMLPDALPVCFQHDPDWTFSVRPHSYPSRRRSAFVNMGIRATCIMTLFIGYIILGYSDTIDLMQALWICLFPTWAFGPRIPVCSDLCRNSCFGLFLECCIPSFVWVATCNEGDTSKPPCQMKVVFSWNLSAKESGVRK